MSALPFIDAHMHLWDLSRMHYAWLSPPFSDSGPNGNVSAITSTYLLRDYRAEAANWNLVGAVHVEAGAADALAETDWLQAIGDSEGLPNVLVAFAQLDHPDVDAVLAAHAQRSRVRSVRHIVNWHSDPDRTYTPRDVTGDAAWARGFGLLGAYGLSFDLQAYPGQFYALAKLIAAHPATNVIVNHAGMGVDLDHEGVRAWRRGMKALASLSNVFVKVSGIGFAYRPWDGALARDRARETIDIFGPQRAMLASDFPTDRLFASFDATMGMLAEAVADFSEDERRDLFARNANRIYRLGLSV